VSRGEGIASVGVRGLEGSEELVDVSQQPDEQRDETSPSRARSRDEDREDLPFEDREDLPEEHPREEPEPPREGASKSIPVRPRLGRHPSTGCCGRGGEVAAEPAALLKGGEALMDPSDFCTCPHTSLHFLPTPARCGPAATAALPRAGRVLFPESGLSRFGTAATPATGAAEGVGAEAMHPKDY